MPSLWFDDSPWDILNVIFREFHRPRYHSSCQTWLLQDLMNMIVSFSQRYCDPANKVSASSMRWQWPVIAYQYSDNVLQDLWTPCLQNTQVFLHYVSPRQGLSSFPNLWPRKREVLVTPSLREWEWGRCKEGLYLREILLSLSGPFESLFSLQGGNNNKNKCLVVCTHEEAV